VDFFKIFMTEKIKSSLSENEIKKGNVSVTLMFGFYGRSIAQPVFIVRKRCIRIAGSLNLDQRT